MNEALIPHASALLILAVVLIVGFSFGILAKRVHLPSITGQIIGGVLLGTAGFKVFEPHSVHGLAPLTEFALGLMAVTVGAHLNFRRLRNAGKRLFLLVLFESIIVPALVFGGLIPFHTTWSVSLLFGTLAISTAPATIVAIVKETRSKGVFVKTLVAAVALNNITCIALFELARVAAHIDIGAGKESAADLLLAPLLQLGKAGLLGCGIALIIQLFTRLVSRPAIVATSGFVTIALALGMARSLDTSPLLSCLFIGMAQTNLTRERDMVVDRAFSSFEPTILAAFFTLAGMELTLDHAAAAGAIAVAFFGLRFVGKLVAANLAMRLAGATAKVRDNLGFALIPQAGVAVGLVLILDHDPVLKAGSADTISLFIAVVLTVVVANEMVGPVLTRFALGRSGETGRDRLRLIDFLREENIVTDFEVVDKEQAIEQLVSLLITSHHLDPALRAPILSSVLARENEASTCFGEGLSVPHGTLPEGESMLGVMAISPKGLTFDTPDGKPVHFLILLLTPDNERQRHLQVLRAIAHSIGRDAKVRRALEGSKSAAHAYEILHSEESESFNYFMDEATS